MLPIKFIQYSNTLFITYIDLYYYKQKSSWNINCFPTGFLRNIQFYDTSLIFLPVHMFQFCFPTFFYQVSAKLCHSPFHTLPVMLIGERIEMFFWVLNQVPNSLVYRRTPMPDFLQDCLQHNDILNNRILKDINLRNKMEKNQNCCLILSNNRT